MPPLRRGENVASWPATHPAWSATQAQLRWRGLAQEATMMTTDASGLIIGVVFTSLVIISLTIAGRLMVRKMMSPNRFFLDDALVLIASMLTLGLCMVSLAGTQYGLGQHEYNLRHHDSDVSSTIMLMWIGQMLYLFAIAFAKFSIISSYLRILPHKRLHQIIWVVLGVCVTFLVASVIAMLLICRPTDATWDPTVNTTTSCSRIIGLLYASGVVSVGVDVVLCLVPLPYFLRLRLPLKQKMGASVLSIIGGLAAVASGFRLACLYEISDDGFDITYNIAEPMIWSVLECAISIIAISIPPMRPLFAKLAPSVFVTNVTEVRDKSIKKGSSRRLPGLQRGTRRARPTRSRSRSSRGAGQRAALERKPSGATDKSFSTAATQTEARTGPVGYPGV